MEHFLEIGQVFGTVYFLLLTVYYFLPASFFYFLIFVWNKKRWEHLRLHDEYPKGAQIRREIAWSVYALGIWAAIITGMYYVVQAGYTAMYFDVQDYGIGYFIGSIFIAMVIHDTGFYWVHRLMHTRWLFPISHKVHHLSVNPTPYDLFAFQPIETLLQTLPWLFIVFVLPFHPWALAIIQFYDVIISTLGHTGIEFMPEKTRNNWFFKWQNSIIHHNYHHIDMRYNHAVYFNIWDRLMGTYHPGGRAEHSKKIVVEAPPKDVTVS